MSAFVHISPEGFTADPWQDIPQLMAADLKAADPETLALHVLKLDATTRVEDLTPWLGALRTISIEFGTSQDGRGFSLARKIRDLGFTGLLRAEGLLHMDQFRHALKAGFDAVAIPLEQAERMPEKEWLQAAAEGLPSYQDRFKKA